MKNNIITQKDFIERWAEKGRFSQGDMQEALDALIFVFEEAVKNGETIKIRNFGTLFVSPIVERKVKAYTDKNGNHFDEQIHPPTKRVTFRLGLNIKNAGKKGS